VSRSATLLLIVKRHTCSSSGDTTIFLGEFAEIPRGVRSANQRFGHYEFDGDNQSFAAARLRSRRSSNSMTICLVREFRIERGNLFNAFDSSASRRGHDEAQLHRRAWKRKVFAEFGPEA